MTSIEERMTRLENIEAIKQLKSIYCEHADNNYDADKVVSLFTPDAIWESEQFGRYEGVAAIRQFLVDLSKSFVFAGHLVMNPRITLTSATTATGVWRLLQPIKFVENGVSQSRLLLARYNDEYVLVDGAWKHAHVKLHANFYENLADGWGEKPQA